MAIVASREELEQLSALVPYPVRCISDPNLIAFPAVIKWVLVHDREDTAGFAKPEEVVIVPIVYAVPFDAGDLLDFYEEMSVRFAAEKVGIEGYDYAESTQTNEGTGSAVEGTHGPVSTETSDSYLRPTSIPDGDH